jgi:hypothetical protein
MARTKTDLSTDTLRKLGVLDALHSPSSEDAAIVEARYDDMHESLKDQGLVYWPNTDRSTAEIPSVVFGAVVDIMAENVALHFGVEIPTVTDAHGRPVSIGTRGTRNLRVHMAKGPSGAPVYTEYY